MRILMGPVLSLRGADAEHWHDSALVVAAKGDDPRLLEVKCMGPGACVARTAPGKELWVHGSRAVYRYDMNISRDTNGATRVEYGFDGTRPWSFHVPAAAGKPSVLSEK